MTTAVLGMGMINTEITAIDKGNGCESELDHSLVDKIVSSDTTIFVSAKVLGLDKERDSKFVMNSTSRQSSGSSETEPLDDNETGADGYVVAPIPEDGAVSGEEKEQSERRHTIAGGLTKTTRLRWANITIREYPRVLGDNVTVMGPPIGLGWEYQDECVYDLAEYDDAMQNSRRTQSELKMPTKFRLQILKEGGFSKQDIQQAVKRANIARNQRKRTVETLKLQPLQEALEKAVRFGKKPITKKKDLMEKRYTI